MLSLVVTSIKIIMFIIVAMIIKYCLTTINFIFILKIVINFNSIKHLIAIKTITIIIIISLTTIVAVLINFELFINFITTSQVFITAINVTQLILAN